MIKNILIPEHIGGYYIFAKRIVGFYVDASYVSATQVHLKGTRVTIEQVFHERIGANDELSYEERVALVVKDILGRVGHYNAVYTALPSSQIIFKTLRLPFTSYEKIKMVVKYEVESLLPFSLDEAVIDFIITKQFPDQGSAEIIVSAVQKSVVADHLSFFHQAGISPERIGVDLFALYSLYQRIPAYHSLAGNVALIDIGATATRIALINDGQLRFIRVLPQGVENFVSAVARATESSDQDAAHLITTFGLTKQDDKTYYDAITDTMSSFWDRVQFTLHSFVSQADQEQPVTKFVLTGTGATIVGFSDFVADKMHVACDLFQTTQLLADKQIQIKKNISLAGHDLISLGIALNIICR